MKKIILFIDRDSQEKGSFFLQIIRKRLPGIKMNICTSVASCVTEVSRTKPYMEKPIIVLFTHNIDRLDDLYEKKDMLQDKKIVMVLPTKKIHDITSIVHRFSPRYFTYMDNQYEDLCDVLHKMIVQ
jgi:hypothetical protein